MDNDEFRRWSQHIADWGADYRARIGDFPVRAQTAPGEILAQIAASPPEAGEGMEAIFADFERIILPGITHWQHPRFFAYFPSNSAPESVLAEYLSSVLSVQCMLWQTSPAATELEQRIVDWLRQALGLPEGFTGTLQDTAGSATLCAILTMRERALGWTGNSKGLSGQPQVRIYASSEVHTSIDRAIWMAGIGSDNLVRIPTTGALRGMDAGALDAAIRRDREAGHLPAGVIAATGGTSTGSCDDLAAVTAVAKRHDLFVHVDAAWAGTAMICPEFRALWAGVDGVDSIVFNPHKWMGAQHECSAHLVRDPQLLLRTIAIHPDYLKTHGRDGIVNFSEWSPQLGRRFRALKLWFLIRAYGLEGLRGMIRNHVRWSQAMAERLRGERDFRIVTEPVLSLFTFRHEPAGVDDPDAHNQALLEAINDDGRIYLTMTTVNGATAIRFQAGQFEAGEGDVARAFEVICEIARRPR